MQQLNIDWKAAIGSGLIAGVVFLALEMMMVPLIGGGSPWGPPRMMAAILLGKGVLPPPATFDAGIVMVAMALHLVLSAVYGGGFSLVVSRLSKGVALATGAVGGLVLYLVNFYGFTAVFPWFAMARTPITIFTHIVFGLVAVWAYLALVKRHQHHATPGGANLQQHGA